jgi:hypothetical protein
VAKEQPNGTYLDVSESVLRLDAATSAEVELRATAFGAPKPGQAIGLIMGAKTAAAAASGLTFPASVTTGGDGRASVKLTAGDPRHPRRDIDGAVYLVVVSWGLAPLDPRALIIVRVFDAVPAVVSPKWADVRDTLVEYARLYPYMSTFVDLSDYAKVKAMAPAIDLTLSRNIDDAGYMPVTRDLSDGKSKMIRRWIKGGCPA